ncbi:MAG: 3-phosphoshikimate 1-carboxyvinyltransferase [Pseudomonadota bacterium]|nr:3-phosphoshikimate 1-carboxyvinyltransferase [Pseudomonadota bacterium]
MKKPFTLKSSKSKPLSGDLSVPSDKSISIRSLIISSLCIGNTKIFGLLESDDVINTLEVLRKLKIKVEKNKEFYEIHGQGGLYSDPQDNLNFGNSGTGIRLMAGLLSTSQINATLTGDRSLASRPMSRVIDPLKKMNVSISHDNGFLPIKILNKRKMHVPINHTLKIGSAQVKSSILLAAFNIKGTTKVLEKIPSRNHTEIMLKYLGANLKTKKNTITLTSPNFLKPKNLRIPGDFSSAAFIIVAVLLSKDSHAKIRNVGLNFYRTGLVDVLKRMNAKINISNRKKFNGELVGDIKIESSNLIATTVRKELSPRLIDEYPILFVAAAYANGTSKFYGLSELKIKESNRLKTMAKALSDAGVKLKLGENSIEISGNNSQVGGNYVQTDSDHRIAMSMLIFGLISEKPIIIDEMAMIKTSFPNFKETFQQLGAKIEEFYKL